MEEGDPLIEVVAKLLDVPTFREPVKLRLDVTEATGVYGANHRKVSDVNPV